MKAIKDQNIKVSTIKDIVLNDDLNLSLEGFYFIAKNIYLKNYKIRDLFISKDFIGQRNIEHKENLELTDYLLSYPSLDNYRKVLPLDLRDTDIENIIVDKDNQFFSIDEDKNLFYTARQYNFKDNNELYLQRSVKYIAYLSKNYRNLSEIKIPDGVDEIYKYAFTFIQDKFTCLDLNDVVSFDDIKDSPLKNKSTNLKKVFAKNLKKIFYHKGTRSHLSCFEHAYIVAPKVYIEDLPLFYKLRLLHGYILHKELYNEDEKEKYEKILKSLKGKLITYARIYNYKDILTKLNITKENALKEEIKAIKKLSKRQACLELEESICNGDIVHIDLLLDNICEFEMPSRALGLASRLLPFTTVKKLLDKGFRYNRPIDAPLNSYYVINNTNDYKVLNIYGRVYGSKKVIANNLFIMLAQDLDQHPFMIGSFDGIKIKDVYDINEVLKIINYIYENELESNESFQDLLLAAALFDNISIIKHLLSMNIKLNEERVLYLKNKKSPIWFKEYYEKAFENGLGLIGLSFLHFYLFKKKLNFKVKQYSHYYFKYFESDEDFINFIEIVVDNCSFTKSDITKLLTNYVKDDYDIERLFIMLELFKEIIISTKADITNLIDYIYGNHNKVRFLEYLNTINESQNKKTIKGTKHNLTL